MGHICQAIWSCSKGGLCWETPCQKGTQKNLNLRRGACCSSHLDEQERMEKEYAVGMAVSRLSLQWALPSVPFWPTPLCSSARASQGQL